MSDDYTIKNWVPSVTATRAGGMDFQKVQESRKWVEMIKQERGIEMTNMMAHIRKWHGEGHLKGYAMGDRLDAEAKLAAELGEKDLTKSKVWFPTMGLGADIPKSTKTIEPKTFVNMVNTSDFGTRRFGQTDATGLLKASSAAAAASSASLLSSADGFADMPGEPLTSKQLVSRMRKMQDELRRVRGNRKHAEKSLRKLIRHERRGNIRGSSKRRAGTKKKKTVGGRGDAKNAATNNNVTGASGAVLAPVKTSRTPGPDALRTSTSSSRRSNSSSRRQARPQSRTPSVCSSVDSLLERISNSGRFASTGVGPLRASTALPSSRRSGRSSRRSSRPVSRVEKRVTKWNPVLQLWEHRDLSLPRGSQLLNARDTYHSNNIAALFSDPRGPGRTTSKDTLAASTDLIKMGLLDELSAKQMHLWTVSPKMRHPRVMSKLTAFAEHAVKNRLKPFAVGRG